MWQHISYLSKCTVEQRLKSILVFSPRLYLGSLNDLSTSGFLTSILYEFLTSLMHVAGPDYFVFLNHRNNVEENLMYLLSF
jgi:hypothetical protein